MNYFLVVGEASGDLHASNLMKGILKKDPGARFRYVGGDLMEAVSPGMIKHYKETSYMMLDAVVNIRKILRHIKEIQKEMIAFSADVNILVDYPGVNLRLAKYAKPRGLKIFYYITPTVWAWKKSRIHTLRKYTDKRFVIFPFEVEYFQNAGVEAEFRGNPVVDAISKYKNNPVTREQFIAEENLDERPIVAVLTGSRKHEINRLLPMVINVSKEYSDYQFLVAGAASVEKSYYSTIPATGNVKLVYNRTYDLLEHSHTGIITSGTATLETALFNVPQVVIYRTNPLAYLIARILVKIKFISQVNLIYGSQLVLEVIQRRMEQKVNAELGKLLSDKEYRSRIMNGYDDIRKKLGSKDVSDRLGARMVELLTSSDQ